MVTEVLISPGGTYARAGRTKCEKNHISKKLFHVIAPMTPARPWRRPNRGETVMTANFARFSARANPALALGILLLLSAAGSAHAIGTPEQRKACTPDVYRLCPGEIPNVRAITACLRRQKASLSEACRAYFEQ
jgi:hypothetical protein